MIKIVDFIQLKGSHYRFRHQKAVKLNLKFLNRMLQSRQRLPNVTVTILSGRWQAPAAVLPPEGPEDKGHGHSRARRAREWQKHAKLSARFGACQCYYMFFTIQPKIAIFVAQFKYLNDGQNA